MKRKTLFVLFVIAMTSFIFVMCRKSGTEIQKTQDDNANPTVLKVNTWLATQMTLADSAGKAKIASLKASLDYSHLYNEDYTKGQTFIIVPVLNGFISVNNTDKKSSSVLLLFVSDTGIRKGNIVQYFDSTSATRLSKGVFNDVFNSRDPSFSGTLSFLTITDSRKYDISYKAGKLFSHGAAQTKPGTNRNGRVDQCIDYYWVTYFADGSDYWQYLFTNCQENDCNQTRVAKNIGLKIDCGGSGGGTGVPGQSDAECCLPDPNIGVTVLPVYGIGAITTINEATNSNGITTKTKIYKWDFWAGKLLWYTWTRTSIETATLDNSSGKWKYISLVHTGDQISGTTPPCVPVSFKMDATNVDYSDDKTRAIMTLYFTESITVSCFPNVPNTGSGNNPDSRWKAFNADQD